MATTGKAAWEKYFKGNGNVDTLVKKAADIYDLVSQSKVIGTLAQGQKIKFLEVKDYDSKPVIAYEAGGKKYKARIKFDMLQKPGVRSASDPNNVKTIDRSDSLTKINRKSISPGVGYYDHPADDYIKFTMK
jgi:hypothetical protein